ncbi:MULTISPECIES: PfkB family carbohydrate kinase [unclassified Streptomyces]|uniref:carbohydrate kinase family protein n=1 Tax=unclassified Streptomyces TaxID=2593676 RepID=UPI0003677C69|nr:MULTISPECIES: PfkB family carbohydrate kinase [unclassified Streptomyces]MYX34589.1 carbohydrate kinase family protein [Streptomyces sp. SID8377]
MDVVGVGALNLDLITGASALNGSPVLARLGAHMRLRRPPESGGERMVDEPSVRAGLEWLRDEGVPLTPEPGGSAFNTLHALGRLGRGLRLGYVGVAGRDPLGAAGPLAVLDGLGIDRRLVATDPDRLCGICLSVHDGGERTLLTHTGANTRIAAHVRERFPEIADYLAAARAVHVTSFLDPDGGAALHRLLAAVRRRSPRTLISFDPGHAWSAEPTADVLAMAAMSDYLLVNGREFERLGHVRKGREGVSVVKYPDRIEVHRPGTVERYAHRPLPDGEVEDATGAGDVFAAGLLAALVADRALLGAGVRLGSALAGHKLRHVGTRGHGGFRAIAADFLRPASPAR